MCQWFETFSTENSFNRLSASWRIVSTSQNSAQSRERLAVAPVSKGTESLSTPSKRTCFFFFSGKILDSVWWRWFPHQPQSGIIQRVMKKETLIPQLFWCAEIRTYLNGLFPWNWATAIVFFPPRNRKQVGNVFRLCSENTKDSVRALFPLVSQHGQP